MDERALLACAASTDTGIPTASEHDPDKQLSLKTFYEACNSQGKIPYVANARCRRWMMSITTRQLALRLASHVSVVSLGRSELCVRQCLVSEGIMTRITISGGAS